MRKILIGALALFGSVAPGSTLYSGMYIPASAPERKAATALFGSSTVAEYSPVDEPDLVIWFDAASNDPSNMTVAGSKVSLWKDKSGNGFDLENGVDATRPLYSAASKNGLGAIACDRSVPSTLYRAADQIVSTGSPFSITIVAKVDSYGPSSRAAIGTFGASGESLFFVHQSGNVMLGASNYFLFGVRSQTETADFGWHYRTFEYNGQGSTDIANYAMYLDGVAQTVESANVSGWSLGTAVTAICGYGNYGDTDNSLTGKIAEIIGTSSLDAGWRTQRHAHIADKWGF